MKTAQTLHASSDYRTVPDRICSLPLSGWYGESSPGNLKLIGDQVSGDLCYFQLCNLQVCDLLSLSICLSDTAFSPTKKIIISALPSSYEWMLEWGRGVGGGPENCKEPVHVRNYCYFQEIYHLEIY